MRLAQRQLLTSVKRVCQGAIEKTAATKVWRDLHTHYAVGELRGRNLHLSERDREQLRLLIKQETNIDVLLDDVDALLRADRITLAQRTSNEKIAGHGISENYVLLASPVNSFFLNGQSVSLLPGTAMICNASCIESIAHLVVVENLSTFYALDQYRWPKECESAVMVFRGSPQWSTQAVGHVVKKADRVTFFGDFDPQGLQLALNNSDVSGWISPTIESVKLCCEAGLNQPHTFRRQHQAHQWLLKHYGNQEQVKQLDKEGLALMQESLVGKPLQYIPHGSRKDEGEEWLLIQQ